MIFLRDYLFSFENGIHKFDLVNCIIHTGLNGKKYLVIHGDIYDSFIHNTRWLAKIGATLYEVMVHISFVNSIIRKKFGLKYWSLSQWSKNTVKGATSFIGKFESTITKVTKDYNCNGVICGHIHFPKIETIDDIVYMNCGDMIENHSVLVETLDGNFELKFINKI